MSKRLSHLEKAIAGVEAEIATLQVVLAKLKQQRPASAKPRPVVTKVLADA